MLAVMAGQGELPKLLIDQLDADGTPFRLCEMEGFSSDVRGDRPLIRFRIETLGSFIAELKKLDVSQICFAGSVARPPLDPSKIDAATLPLVPRMMAALQSGDDAALRLVLGFFDEAGIAPVGVHELRTDLLPTAGVLGAHQPEDRHGADAARGIEIIGAMARVDVGQSCIVANGQALAIEALPGTDWMMQSLMTENTPLSPDLMAQVIGYGGSLQRSKTLPAGGILVKASKPGQELRIDMPVIGPDTVRRAVQVQLEGIVIEQGRVMVLDAPTCIEIADRHGLFLQVIG
ncbi:MAG: UDP-2,3-diacylglucosamine diphosphatase LpxI [Pseudomonadota bacterium]